MYTKKKKYLSYVLAFALCSTTVATAFAGENQKLMKEEQLDEYTLPLFYVYGYRLPNKAKVGTKIEQELKDIPASVTVVDQSEIERLGVYNLNDALEYSAGITVAPYGYHPLHTMSKIRGFDLKNTNLIVDGMKQFSTSSQVQSPEIYGVEQVEILRGPSSLYGASAIGGTVNLKMKEPTEKKQSELQLQIGSEKEKFFAFDLNTGKNQRQQKARLVFMYRGQDLFYDKSQNERFYFAPSLTQEIGKKTQITFKPFYQQDKVTGNAYFSRTRLEDDPLYGILPDRFFVGVKDFDKYEFKQTGISYELRHEINENIHLYQKGNYRNTNSLSQQTTGMLQSANGMFIRFGAISDVESFAYGLDQFISIMHGTKEKGGHSILGFDLHYEREWQQDKMRMLNPWNKDNLKDYVQGTKPIPKDPEDIMEMGEIEYFNKESGIYLQHTEKINDLTINLALRKGFYLEHSDRDSYEEKETPFTGQIGFNKKLGRNFYPYAHFHNSFEPALHLDENKKLLKPTRGREFEVGIKYLPEKEATQVTLALFDLTRQNVHVNVPNTNYFKAIGEMKSKGLEIEYRAALTKTLSILGSYTYLDAKITKDTIKSYIGRRPKGVAEHTLNVRLDKILHQYQDGEIIFGLGARYLGQRLDDSNKISLGGVTLYDTSLRYTKGTNSLNLHIRNLFNKKYLTSIEELWRVPTGFSGMDRTYIMSYIHKF